MEPVYTYKAISFELRFFGRKPADLILALFSCFMLYAVSNSFFITLIYFIVIMRITKKIARRPAGTIRSTVRFLLTPKVLGVSPDNEISSYENIMKKKE